MKTEIESIVKTAFKESFDYLSAARRDGTPLEEITTAAMNEDVKNAILKSGHISKEIYGLTGLAGRIIGDKAKDAVQNSMNENPLNYLLFALEPRIAADMLSGQLVNEQSLVVPLTLIQFGYLIGLHQQKETDKETLSEMTASNAVLVDLAEQSI